VFVVGQLCGVPATPGYPGDAHDQAVGIEQALERDKVSELHCSESRPCRLVPPSARAALAVARINRAAPHARLRFHSRLHYGRFRGRYGLHEPETKLSRRLRHHLPLGHHVVVVMGRGPRLPVRRVHEQIWPKSYVLRRSSALIGSLAPSWPALPTIPAPGRLADRRERYAATWTRLPQVRLSQ
jgi:hypothetical protein